MAGSGAHSRAALINKEPGQAGSADPGRQGWHTALDAAGEAALTGKHRFGH